MRIPDKLVRTIDFPAESYAVMIKINNQVNALSPYYTTLEEAQAELESMLQEVEAPDSDLFVMSFNRVDRGNGKPILFPSE